MSAQPFELGVLLGLSQRESREEWGNDKDLTDCPISRPAGIFVFWPGLSGSLGRLDLGLVLTARFGLVTLGRSCLDLVITGYSAIRSKIFVLRRGMTIFTVDDSNSFLSPKEILPIAQENKYLWIFQENVSYFIMKMYVVCTH